MAPTPNARYEAIQASQLQADHAVVELRADAARRFSAPTSSATRSCATAAQGRCTRRFRHDLTAARNSIHHRRRGGERHEDGPSRKAPRTTPMSSSHWDRHHRESTTASSRRRRWQPPSPSSPGTQLIQGEPDASSFPSAASAPPSSPRYTAWDVTSPLTSSKTPRHGAGHSHRIHLRTGEALDKRRPCSARCRR